jgi:hypothetical protein
MIEVDLRDNNTGPRYIIQNDQVSAVVADLSCAGLGGRAPKASGIDDPDAAVAAPMASQTFGANSYDPFPSLRPLNFPVQRRIRFFMTFSKIRCMKSYGNEEGK